jgi:hypothetical protein
MTRKWVRAILLTALVLPLYAGIWALAAQPFRQSVTRCNPGRCGTADVCGTANQVPYLCAESKDGPRFVATYACCCCTEDSKGRWFFGE